MLKNLWDKKRSFTYIKVVTFFLLGIFLFFLLLISTRDVNFFKGTYPIAVKFDFAEGLRRSSPVRFCGVDVGEVKSVEIKEEDDRSFVYVYAKIEKGIQIPHNSDFFINSLSLFGEKYLEITPPLIAIKYMNSEDVVEGISPIPLFNVFATFTKTMEEVRIFAKEGKLKTSFENTLMNIESISLGLKGLIEDMKNKKGIIGRLFYDDSLYETTEEFIQDLKEHPWKLLHKPK